MIFLVQNFFNFICIILLHGWSITDILKKNLAKNLSTCYDDPGPQMEVDDVVFVKSQLGESVDWAAEQLK